MGPLVGGFDAFQNWIDIVSPKSGQGGKVRPLRNSKKAWLGMVLQEGAQSIPIRATLGAGWVAAADAKTSTQPENRHRYGQRFIRIPVRRAALEDSVNREAERIGPRGVQVIAASGRPADQNCPRWSSEKNSVRVYVFRFALKLRHCPTQPALRICTKNGSRRGIVGSL